MTKFGIENAEEYAETHGLVKISHIQCACIKLNVKNCKVCNGSGLYEEYEYPQKFVLTVPDNSDIVLGQTGILSGLLKALGLSERYGAEYPHKLLAKINNWEILKVGINPTDKILVSRIIWGYADDLTRICNEAMRREERVIWG